jgi:conjugative transposon TraM protein
MEPNKIDLKQPKYVLPILVLPFVIMIFFLIKDMSFGKEEESTLVETEDINMDIPDASPGMLETRTKFGALQNVFKKSSDFSSIQAIERETVDDPAGNAGSLYTTDEMRMIDSLSQVSQIKGAEIKQQQLRYQSPDFLKLQEDASSSSNEREPPAKSRMEEEMELFKAQMAYIDSLQNPKPTPPASQPRQETVPVEKPLEVVKIESPGASYFNTIGADKGNAPITAILDESNKVSDGSRIRIRLLDKVIVGKHILNKGAYLYGNVTGFKAQRVIITVSSILVNSQRLKVNLSVYDNDGQEGFYIPASEFREFTKNIGGQVQGQSINIQQQASGVEQLAFGALQDIYQSTTQAVSKTIRQNKARLKFGSHIYLINNDNNEKNNN